MKKSFTKWLAIALAFCMALSITGCSMVKNGVSSIASKFTKEDYSGTYYCIEMVDDGETVDMTEYEELGIIYTLKLAEDGTFVMGEETMDDPQKGTYEIKEGVITLTVDKSPVSGTIKDGIIEISDGEYKMTFDKNHVPADPDPEYLALFGDDDYEEEENEATGELPITNSEDGGEGDDTSVPPVTTVVEAKPGFTVSENGIQMPEIKESVALVDNDNYTIEMTDVYEEYSEIVFKLHVVNKTDKDLRFSSECIAVNHVEVDAYVFESIKPGKEAYVSLDMYEEALKSVSIDSIENMQIWLEVYETSSFDGVGNEVMEVVFGDATADDKLSVSDFNESDIKVLFDNELATFILYGTETNEDWNEWNIYCYIVNKTDKVLRFSVDDASINNIMLDPWGTSAVWPGTAKLAEMNWDLKEMKTSGINPDEHMTIELPMEVSEYENWGADNLMEEIFVVEFN